MALTIQQRTQVWRGVMRWLSSNRNPCAALKSEIYDAATDTGMIADMDNWLETHQGNVAPDTVGINGGINAAYRGKFTADHKTLVFCAVASMRRSPEFARAMLGEID